MNIKKYTREQIKELVNDGICPLETLNHYDVIKALSAGEKIQDIAFNNNLSRQHIYKIKDKYLRK